MADINLSPYRSDPREFTGGTTTVATVKHGMVVVADSATTNAADVKIATAAGQTLVRGVVYDHGDPNNSDLFASGDHIAICKKGVCETLLAAGATASKGAPCICAATGGGVKEVASETNFQIVGYFDEDYDNSAGSNAVLISVDVNPTQTYKEA